MVLVQLGNQMKMKKVLNPTTTISYHKNQVNPKLIQEDFWFWI